MEVARRLWRSSMGRSEFTTRWPTITIYTLVGSIISNMIAVWIELRHVGGGEPEGWRGRVARRTLIEEEAREATERGQ